jgi:hypothetical protein
VTSPLEPHEAWAAIEAQADEDDAEDTELRAVAAMSDADLDAELRAMGVDPGEVAGWAAAAREKPAEGELSAAVMVAPVGPRGVAESAADPARRRRRLVLALATAGAAAAAGGYVYGTRQPEPQPPVVPTVPTVPTAPKVPGPAPSDKAPVEMSASDLRASARAACDTKRWQECLALLDAAAAKDPAGDDAGEVKALRARAEKGIAAGPK